MGTRTHTRNSKLALHADQAFLAQPTLRLRLRYLWQRLWPSRDYMAYLYARQDLGYWGLITIRARTALRRFLRLKINAS